ncbi:MAG: MobF family relaxase, partial [Acidimicrobiales bacterium]
NRRDAKVPRVEGWGTRRFPGAGFVAAQFRHRTSRAGDPQLHWHVLVANITRGPDRRWTALDATGLYRSQRAAGAAFQAALRRELTARLGVEWTPPVKDACEIAGIPQRIVRLFSKRREEIEAELERLGASGSKAAQAATLATRKTKAAIDPDGIVERWQHEAEAAGWGPTQLDALLAGSTAHARHGPVDIEQLAAVVADRLIAQDSTFTRHDVTKTVASVMQPGATGADVDRLTAGVLALDEIVTIRDPATLDRPAGWEQRYTTRRLIASEAELADAIASGVASHTGALAPDGVTIACAVASLGDDQHAAATRLCTQGNAIEVLVGRAGTGKTYTLAAVASAYRAVGWNIVGVAPSARAARELETGGHIPAFTIPRFDHHINDHPLTTNTVVVVDEAGMCGTIDLYHVVTTARRAGAKVILVGDHHQLPEIAAGGGLANAIATLGDHVCELTTNRRQNEAWEIDALEDLRHGDVTTAWNAYLAHDRVRVADDPVVLHRSAVDEWWSAHTAGSDALLLAGTRSEAQALNRLARRRAADEGLLAGPELTVGGTTFQSGDRVLACRNDTNQHTPDGRAIRIDNGMVGTVVAVDVQRGTLDMLLRSRETVRFDHDYLAAGFLEHGYAMTIHKSQGATCDAVFIVGPAGLYREAAYVALSRARQGAFLYATNRQAAEFGERDHARGLPLPGETERPEHELLATIGRSEAKSFATRSDPAAALVADLAHLDLATLEDRCGHAATAETRAKAARVRDPADDIATLERARHARRNLAVERRVRALDRDNVGTITAVHDTSGNATVLFVADDGTSAVRTLSWSELKPIDHPDPVDITHAARRWLDQEAARIEHASDLWAAALAEWSIEPGDVTLLRRAIETRRETLAYQMHADAPEWLTWWIGTRPADPAGATVWDDTVAHIAVWRDLHHIAPHHPGLGPEPEDPNLCPRWLDAMATTLAKRTWLANRVIQPQPTVGEPSLTPIEIHDRISHLDRLFADAPPDQSRIIDDLIAGGRLDTPDLYSALADATKAQSERNRWILANWPYIVEHHELQRLAAQHDALAHWPTPVRSAVQSALDALAATLDTNEPTEERTLAQLHEALAALDPGRRLRELTEDLVAVNDRLAHVESQLAAETGHERRALLTSERDTLIATQSNDRATVTAERDAIADRRWEPNDTDHLRTAIVHRTTTIYQRAVTDRHQWVVDLLNELDDRGTLEQLRPRQLHQLIADTAIQRDLGAEPAAHSMQLSRVEAVLVR